MTEEIYNKATYLRSIIEEEKKVLKYWKEAVDATEETIALSNAFGYDGYNGYVKTSILMFMSFKELKDMAIERITNSLERHQKLYEEL